VALAAPAPAALPAVAALPLRAQAAPAANAAQASRPGALPRLSAAATAALSIVSRPSSAELDSSRADFTEKRAGDGVSGADAPRAGEPAAGPAPLAPASKDSSAARAKVPAPAPATPLAPRGARGYLAGVFTAQVANNALVITLPLALLSLGQPIGMVALLTTITTAFDMSGTIVSGWLTSRFSPRAVLIGATAARAVALGAAAALLATGAATVPSIVGLYIVDALARGVTDTARNTVPLQLVGKNKASLDRLNSLYQTFFELGGVVGPFLMIPVLKTQGALSHWLVAAGFAASAAAYLLIPRAAPSSSADGSGSAAAAVKPAARLGALRAVLADRAMRLGLFTVLALSLTPAFRALLPALFADSLLRSASQAAPLVLAFGLGGTAGSMLYNRLSGRMTAPAWLRLGALGAGALALAWIPGALWPMAAGIFVFALTNVMARLAVTSTIQERIPDGAEGGVMSALRFGANLASMGLRLSIGVIVSVVPAPHAAFAAIGTGIMALAGAQLVSAARLQRRPPVEGPAAPPAGPRLSKVHGMPGRLIVVEGLDGSGKSTQLELLKEHLESQGLKVVVTSWNSSDLLSETVKKAKREQTLTPRTFALLNAADFADRVEKIIKPALKEGAIVLADRWYYTALARDAVRGNDPAWLRSLYKDSLRPDLALYFKLPVDTAIGRVLARTEGRLGLSEDFDDEPRKKVLGQNAYAVGRDMDFHPDDKENFRRFQTRVVDQYEGHLREFGLRAMDASRAREAQQASVLALVSKELGSLQSFKKAQARKANPFDKDPSADSEAIRRNYLNEKKGAHFYFRNMLLPMQARFAQLMDMSLMPRVLLHGSPHVDNYAKSAQGAAMIDFDRSRVGPYAWDLTRLLVSISLRRKKASDEFLDKDVEQELRRGYLRGLRHPDRPFSEMRKLKDIEPGEGETSVAAYLAANKKWAKEMRQNALPPDDAQVQALLASYMKSTGQADLLQEYDVAEAGRGHGSMGLRGIFLVALRPRDAKSGKDAILLSFKQTRTDPDTEWYTSPYKTENQRMEAAAALYAPGWEQHLGAATLDGVEFQARGVPPLNAKLKKMLSHDEQRDLAYAAGTQLGRAHRLWLDSHGGDAQALESHLDRHWDELIEASTTIRDELVDAHKRYLKRMRRDGLEPGPGESDD
jgi:dTMP kinase